MTNKPWLKKDNDTKEIIVMGAKLEIRKLTFGESRKSINGAFRHNPITKQNELDQTLAGILRSIKMIVSWELTDENDKELPIDIGTFDMLDEEFVSELVQVMNTEDESELDEKEKK